VFKSRIAHHYCLVLPLSPYGTAPLRGEPRNEEPGSLFQREGRLERWVKTERYAPTLHLQTHPQSPQHARQPYTCGMQTLV
jgi:hypothetical protein